MTTGKLYRFYCEYCGYSKYTDGSDVGGLVPYKRSKLMTELPKRDATGKLQPAVFKNLPPKFKCPKCGRLISARRVELPQEKKPNEGLDFGGEAGAQGPQLP